MRRALLLVGSLLAGSCTSFAPSELKTCVSDDECPGDQLCFAEGCGDPGKSIVVEVAGSSQTSQRPRDFSIDDGTLGATRDFNLGEPLKITGQFLLSSADATSTAYAQAVTVRAEGHSRLLPGITRTFEARFDRPERGYFEMNVAAGDFHVTATPGITSVALPPAELDTSVEPEGQAVSLSFVFPGAPSLLEGGLVRFFDTSVDPPEVETIRDPFIAKAQDVPGIDLQVIDPDTGALLSQRQPASLTDGTFQIGINPLAREGRTMTVLARPHETGAPVPTKQFTLENPVTGPLVLQLGDFGDNAVVSGTIVDADGQPVADAQVLIDGVVPGDGSFRSKVVQTDDAGRFELRTLASRNQGSFTVSVVAPRSSGAANLDLSATVSLSTDAGAQLSPATIALPRRVQAHGLVRAPDGKVQGGVLVKATRQFDVEPLIPAVPAETTTAADGSFTLALEPGVWLFEYQPQQLMFPFASRLITIGGTVDENGDRSFDTTLKPVQLSFGRTVSGVVTGNGSKADQPMAFAQVKFYRVTSVGGRPVSILLGSAIADESGRYSVVLPTVSATGSGLPDGG